MLKFGHIDCTWTAKDFQALDFQLHSNPYRGFELVDDKDSDRFTIGVFVVPGSAKLQQLGDNWSNLQTKVYQVSKMTPGMALPLHRDRYQTYRNNNNIKDVSTIRRVIVFLEDWKSGHYLEVDGTPFVSWKAGDWVSWVGTTEHLAINLGHEDRYTLQITGIDNDLNNCYNNTSSLTTGED